MSTAGREGSETDVMILRISAQKSKKTAGTQNARDIVEGRKRRGQVNRRFLVASYTRIFSP